MPYALFQVHIALQTAKQLSAWASQEQRPCYKVLPPYFFPIHLCNCDSFSPSSASFVLNFFPLCFSPYANGNETEGKKNQEKSD